MSENEDKWTLNGGIIRSAILKDSFDVGLTYAENKRHLPRLSISRIKKVWTVRYTAQNNSYFAHSSHSLITALRLVVATWHKQRWSLWVRL